ncbi:EscT/YscT/HrcT family type III secretion system export apparatus protein [Pandoraea horticolens]|uniref:EscT/YscT/HrcT family type III secretion system export apparatus protein n=1 Tax=Pandoraea horticolens TaxID=2508298 RepID=A0A5E4XL49_9BURK|nr:type III secretion system export apparatus subunit SctT [Pandoraea horticolens]VVE36858.1 EscT/YscT/HrcT family type III secretion system export apparatus protein [Pandoraea horticolens]
MTEWLAPFYRELGAVAIAYARVAPVFYLMPFLNDRVLANGVIRNCLIVVVIFGLGPRVPNATGSVSLLGLCMSEALVGITLGVTLALPFWVATAIGELIDNQRGATISDSIDPATGVEASVLGPFVSLFYAAAFLQQGGMLMIVQALYNSYRHMPVGMMPHADAWRFGVVLTDLVAKSISLAAPVLIVMFLSDILLGIFSRFCPQANPFSLSLSVKSIVAFLVFHLYFMRAAPDQLNALWGQRIVP